MLIGDIIKETGLTRRAIYFYEEKGLVEPEKDEDSGIRSYSQGDLHKLITILRLRELDMSIADITNILMEPGRAEFILQRHAEGLEGKLNDLVASMGKLNTIMTNFPPNGDLENFQLAADLVMSRRVQSEMDHKFNQDQPMGYVRRITMQLFEAFLDLPLNSKERWDNWYNLLSKVEDACNDEIIRACEDLFGSWDLEYLYEDFRLRKKLVWSYSKFTPRDCELKSKEIIQNLIDLKENPREREKWLDYYFNFITPIMGLDGHAFKKDIESLSSVYGPYCENFGHLVQEYLRPYMESQEGLQLRNTLKELLASAYREDIYTIQFFDFYSNTINIDH